MISLLILLASLPVPLGYIHNMLRQRGVPSLGSEEDVGGQEMHRERYTKCSSSDQLDGSDHNLGPADGDLTRPRATFLPLGTDHYHLLPQRGDVDDDEEEEDTGM